MLGGGNIPVSLKAPSPAVAILIIGGDAVLGVLCVHYADVGEEGQHRHRGYR